MNWLNLIELMQHMAVVILFLVIGHRLLPPEFTGSLLLETECTACCSGPLV